METFTAFAVAAISGRAGLPASASYRNTPMAQQSLYVKYPRTPHLLWSPGASGDDERLIDTALFSGREVVVTEKMDGENTTMYRDYMHARSVDGRHHPSRDRVKALHAALAYSIPEGWRLCGENLYARHSVAYNNLPGYFFLFSVWDAHNCALSWSDTKGWADLLGLPLPAVFYRGQWSERAIRSLRVDTAICEGYVVRTVEGFHYRDFARHIAKWVRPHHVQTDEHWMHGPIVPNTLAAKE